MTYALHSSGADVYEPDALPDCTAHQLEGVGVGSEHRSVVVTRSVGDARSVDGESYTSERHGERLIGLAAPVGNLDQVAPLRRARGPANETASSNDGNLYPGSTTRPVDGVTAPLWLVSDRSARTATLPPHLRGNGRMSS